jgi:hypothetical protein
MSRHFIPTVALLLSLGTAHADLLAQAEVAPPPTMQRFIVEREIPGASRMTVEQLQAGAAKSNSVLRSMGPDIQWVQSYVAGDKIYCVYQSPNEALIRQHAALSGFPASRITPIAAVIDPTTASSKR